MPGTLGRGIISPTLLAASQLYPAADYTYFVSKNGSDSNSGRAPYDAWLTIGHAIANAGWEALINVGPGTYNETVTPTGQWIKGYGTPTRDPTGTVIIPSGNSSPGVIVNSTATLENLTVLSPSNSYTGNGFHINGVGSRVLNCQYQNYNTVNSSFGGTGLYQDNCEQIYVQNFGAVSANQGIAIGKGAVSSLYHMISTNGCYQDFVADGSRGGGAGSGSITFFNWKMEAWNTAGSQETFKLTEGGNHTFVDVVFNEGSVFLPVTIGGSGANVFIQSANADHNNLTVSSNNNVFIQHWFQNGSTPPVISGTGNLLLGPRGGFQISGNFNTVLQADPNTTINITGGYGNVLRDVDPYLAFITDSGTFTEINGRVRASSIPSFAAHTGDKVWNSAPSTGNPVGWVNTSTPPTGTTWKGFGAVL